MKIKKNDVWIDMTPMSDVMVLLLTFFMLSANFVKNEVVKVMTPQSRTEVKVPSTATLDITIDSLGRVYIGTDKVVTMEYALDTLLSKEFSKYKDKLGAQNKELRATFKANNIFKRTRQCYTSCNLLRNGHKLNVNTHFRPYRLSFFCKHRILGTYASDKSLIIHISPTECHMAHMRNSRHILKSFNYRCDIHIVISF